MNKAVNKLPQVKAFDKAQIQCLIRRPIEYRLFEQKITHAFWGCQRNLAARWHTSLGVVRIRRYAALLHLIIRCMFYTGIKSQWCCTYLPM